MARTEMKLVIPPAPVGRIVLPDLTVEMSFYPNAFRRFWYWALLGWKWERIE